uniref:Uncharacterized protein n=1 Tax=Leersia perrieri TaxID=77586 RepID=A0A0D9VEQ5_9ORYZ
MAASLDGTRLYAEELSFHRIGADRSEEKTKQSRGKAGFDMVVKTGARTQDEHMINFPSPCAPCNLGHATLKLKKF